MNETALFEYTGGSSPIYRLNAGIKLLLLLAFSIAAASLPQNLLSAAAVPIFVLVAASGRTTRRQFLSMWKIFILFAASGAVRGYTASSAVAGIVFAARLIILAAAGVLFYSTTRVSSLRIGLKRVFSLIPFISGAHLAELTVMALYILPLIFKVMDSLREARYSRCFNPRKNIIRTFRFLSVPLMIEMFQKTDEMADAWYSRGYTPEK